jgi:hypothetical protein
MSCATRFMIAYRNTYFWQLASFDALEGEHFCIFRPCSMNSKLKWPLISSVLPSAGIKSFNQSMCCAIKTPRQIDFSLYIVYSSTSVCLPWDHANFLASMFLFGRLLRLLALDAQSRLSNVLWDD